MKKTHFILTLLLFALFSLRAQERYVKVIDFNGLEPYLNKQSDTTYVINFWATWCAPCVKEMPDFQKVVEKYKNEKLKLLFVSLDMPNLLESRLIPFIEKYGIASQVVLLDDPNSNAWIDKVDSSWTGSIPATLIYNKNSREFFEAPLYYNELDSIVKLKIY